MSGLITPKGFGFAADNLIVTNQEVFKMSDQIEKSGFHYFVASFAGWAVAATVKEALRLLMAEDKGMKIEGCNVFLVPVPQTEKYAINFFQPQVKDTKFCGFYNYTRGFEFEHLLIEAPDATKISVEDLRADEERRVLADRRTTNAVELVTALVEKQIQENA